MRNIEQVRKGTEIHKTKIYMFLPPFRQLHESIWNNKVRGGEDDDGLGRLLRQVECHTAEVVKMMLLLMMRMMASMDLAAFSNTLFR